MLDVVRAGHKRSIRVPVGGGGGGGGGLCVCSCVQCVCACSIYIYSVCCFVSIGVKNYIDLQFYCSVMTSYETHTHSLFLSVCL